STTPGSAARSQRCSTRTAKRGPAGATNPLPPPCAPALRRAQGISADQVRKLHTVQAPPPIHGRGLGRGQEPLPAPSKQGKKQTLHSWGERGGDAPAIFGEARMVFSSNVFLFLFLPIFLGLYYLCPNRGRNLLILIGSYTFYAWW